MHRTPLSRRWRVPVAIITGPALAVGALVAPATAASASTTLTQTGTANGVVVAGNAFGDQLQVSGADGTVTFTQSSGLGDLAVSGSGQVSAASTLAAGTYTASGTDTDTSGDSGTWSYTLQVLQPAPSGFASQAVNVYQSEYTAAQLAGQGSALEPVSQYQSDLSQLSQAGLALLYYATQQEPEWAQIPALMQSVASALPPSGLTATATTSATTSASQPAGSGTVVNTVKKAAKGTAAKGTEAKSTPATGTTATAPHPKGPGGRSFNATESGANPVEPYAPDGDSNAGGYRNCSSDPNIPDAAIFAVQIVLDIATMLYQIIRAATSGFSAAQLVTSPAAGAAAVVAGAAQLTDDTLKYEQLPLSECKAADEYGYVANIDNTTTQSYALLTSLASAVTQLQSTGNATQQDVQDVSTQLTNLQQTLGTAISNDTQTLQDATGDDTAAVFSQLATDRNALESDVATVDSDQKTLSQAVTNEVDSDSSTVESDLSGDLTQILAEVDNKANVVTSLVAQDDQQLMNTLQSNFSTQQSEYNSELKHQIEDALANPGAAPPVHLILPASQGGFLDSTPVGVQEVVTDDMNALAVDGVTIPASAQRFLQDANAALAAGQYMTAYEDYAQSYEDFT